MAWGLFALSAGGWAAVGIANAFVGLNSLPFPPADLRFGIALAPAVVALALLPSAPPLWTDRLRTLLDGSVVAGSLLFISWAIGLGTAYRRADGDVHSLNALTHPVGDLVLAVMVAFLLYGAIRTARLSRLLLGVGLFAFLLLDSLSTWSQQAVGFSGLIGWEWSVGFLAMGSGAIAEWRSVRRASSALPSFTAAVAVLYLPLVAAAALATVQRLEGQPSDSFLYWDGLAVITLLVAREVLTLQTNRSLRRTFDQRLAARTEQLSQSEAHFRSIVARLPDATMVLDSSGVISYESEAIERVLGRAPRSEKDRSWLTLVHPDDHPRLESVLEKSRNATAVPVTFEARLSHGDEGWRQAELTLTNQLEDRAVNGFVLTIRDITERKAIDDQLTHHALHDSLTGLANRALFRDRLEQSVVRAARRREQPSVLLLDVDGMRKISETLGNRAADEVLIAVADRLRECIRAGDTAARLTSDDFAVLLEDSQDPAAPAQVADRILTELARVKLGNPPMPLTAGIGIATLPAGMQNPDELLRNADTALSEAKAAGQGKIAIYDRAASHAVESQLELEADLQRGIERKEFVIHYQPIVRLKDGSPTAVEALVRWVHPWRGLLLPGDFILAADKTGAIVSLGRWLMLEAAQQVRRWQEKLGIPTLGLAVNLSVRQLTDEGLANDIRHVLAETGLPASLLMLETTESAVLEDLQRSMTVLAKLKDVGANLAIDDSRSGPTALAYVRHLPVDTVKIDRSFVMNLGKHREREQVEGMVKAAEWLKVAMIAEGIEEPGQLHDLVAMGCELGQGFYFSKPLAAPQMFDYLDTANRKAA